MSRTRVLVVDDSITVRKRVVDALADDPAFEVVGEASDGREAIELCHTLRPDVITLDMVMPVMNGLAATEQIMAYCPTPIVIVSASVNRGEAFDTFAALAAGALDVFDKSDSEEDDDDWNLRLRQRVRVASRVKVITHPRAKLTARAAERSRPALIAGAGAFDVVAIGASTGGPQALTRLLPGLGGDFALPILIVVHLDAVFHASFAAWLDAVSPIRVATATDGMPLPPRGVVLAPGDQHLVVERGRLRLQTTAPRHSCRPSVDVLFESLARELGPRTLACILTGMGVDGAAGLLAIKQSGGFTIAQDQASSLIFGMPAAAIERGAARAVVRLDDLASTLVSLAAPA